MVWRKPIPSIKEEMVMEKIFLDGFGLYHWDRGRCPGAETQEVYADEAAAPYQKRQRSASAEVSAAAPISQDVPVPPETGTFTASVIHVPAAFTNNVTVVLENYNTESEVTTDAWHGQRLIDGRSGNGSYNLVGLNVEGDNPMNGERDGLVMKYAVSGGMDTEITIQLKSDKAVESEEASTASASDSSTASAGIRDGKSRFRHHQALQAEALHRSVRDQQLLRKETIHGIEG